MTTFNTVGCIDRDYKYKSTFEDNRFSRKLVEIILHEGYSLWIIGATYAKNLPKTKYFVIAKSAAEASKKFKEEFTWLSFIDKPVKCSPEEEYEILHNPSRVSSIWEN